MAATAKEIASAVANFRAGKKLSRYDELALMGQYGAAWKTKVALPKPPPLPKVTPTPIGVKSPGWNANPGTPPPAPKPAPKPVPAPAPKPVVKPAPVAAKPAPKPVVKPVPAPVKPALSTPPKPVVPVAAPPIKLGPPYAPAQPTPAPAVNQPAKPVAAPVWNQGAAPSAAASPMLGSYPGWTPQQSYDWWSAPKNPDVPGAVSNADMAANYTATMQPWAQFEQNASQYGTDFNEAQRRWTEENSWNQGRDTYNMGLSTRQQNAAEGQAATAANQWTQQFNQTNANDVWSQGFNNAQLAQQGDISKLQYGTQQNVANTEAVASGYRSDVEAQANKYQSDVEKANSALQWKTQADISTKMNEAQNLQSRYQAFGRAKAPAATWARNW